MEDERLDFDIECPNNHNTAVSFTKREFEEWRKSGKMVFHCNTCDTDWTPSGEDIAKFRREFDKVDD